jgi:hypothetical protein
MSLYDYIILTAAITRPTLHANVFPAYLALIGSARVKWLINVDDVGTAHSVVETIAHLQTLLSAPNTELEFFRPNGAGCFFEATRRLALRAHELLDECRTGVIWLEDDWASQPRHLARAVLTRLRLVLARDRVGRRLRSCPGTLTHKQLLLERHQRGRPDALWFVSLVPRSRVSFNPGIWSKTLFAQAMWKILSSVPSGTIDDPETLCADPCNEPAAYRRLTVFVDPLFQDAGRRWSAEHGTVKWEKQASSLQRQGSVTYSHKALRPPSVAAEADRLCGWLLVPVRQRHAPKLVGRIRILDGRLRAHLFWVPFVGLELRMIEEWQAEVYLHRLQAWGRTYPFKKLSGRVVWHWGRHAQGDRVALKTGNLRFSSVLTRTMPARVIWVGPMQAVAGLLVYVATLVSTLSHLDAA